MHWINLLLIIIKKRRFKFNNRGDLNLIKRGIKRGDLKFNKRGDLNLINEFVMNTNKLYFGDDS